MSKKTLAAIVGLSLAPSFALAQSMAVTTTDLNLREGPGSNYSVIDTMASGAEVSINGCVEGTKWCQISHGGAEGFAYADYLAAKVDGSDVAVSSNPGLFGSVGFDDTTTQGAVGGAVIGALTGGPVGAAVGAGVGAAAANVSPSQEVIEYVGDNTIEPIYLSGEAVVGAAVPQEVQLREIPQYEYRYANINGERVLIDPNTRQIVYVIR